MKQRLIRLGSLAAALPFALFVIGAFARTVDAQAPSGIPQVLQAHSALQEDVDALLNPILDNVRITPPVTVAFEEILNCQVANVTDHELHVQIALTYKFTTGTNTFTLNLGEVVLAAGAIDRRPVIAGHASSPYCTFTVVHGSERDIRASLSASNADTLDRVVVTAE